VAHALFLQAAASEQGTGRNRRLSKDYEYRVPRSELMIDVAATWLMLNRVAR
jgi:hypothetical protein